MSDSPQQITGGCYCGAVQFQADEPSLFCAHCHCDNCRKAHGAAFVTWVGYPKQRFEITRGTDDLVRFTTDTDATRSFCRRCGTTLLYESPRWADEVHVTRASIEGETDRAPHLHVYVDFRASWCPITDDLPQRGKTSG